MRMESTWPEAHRRDGGDPQPPQFRAFAPPRISIADSTRSRAKGERGSGGSREKTERVQTVPRQHSRNTHTRARATRDCIYAESYLPRLKSHRGGIPWQECLGNSLRARSHSTPLRSSPSSSPLSISLHSLPRLLNPSWFSATVVHRRRRMQMHR